MDTDSLTYKTLKNFGFNLAGYGWSFVFALVITPILVMHLGVRNYGVFIFIGTISSLFGLLDLGISAAAQKYIAEYAATDQRANLQRLIGSMNTLFLGIGSVGLIGLGSVGLIGCHYFACNAITASGYPTLFLLSGVTFFVESLNSIYATAPTALQRFDISTKVGTTKTTLQQVAILILVLAGFSLKALFLSTLCFSIIFFFISQRIARGLIPEAILSFNFDVSEVKKVYAFGLSLVVNNLSTSSLVHLDRFLIPIFLGPSQLTYYSLPGTISSKIPGITGNISSVIFPVAAHVHGSGDTAQLSRVYVRSMRLVTILSASMSVALFIFADAILRYWLSDDFVRNSGRILMIFTAIAFLVSLQTHASNFLYGMGKLKTITNISVFMALLNLALLVVFIPLYGILGAAWAYVLSLLPIFYLLYVIESKYLGLHDFFARNVSLYAKVLIAAVALFLISYFILLPILTSLVALVIFGPFSVMLYVALYYIFGFFEEEDLVTLAEFNKVVLRRAKTSFAAP